MEYTYDSSKVAVDALRGRADLKLPKAVRAELDKIAKLEMMALELGRNVPNHGAMIDAIIANNATDDAALAAEALHPARVAAVKEAINVQVGTAANAIAQNGHAIMDEIKEKIWSPAMEKVLAIADQVAPEEDPTSLMRTGKNALAKAWIEAEQALEVSAEAIRLTEVLFGVPSVTGNNAFHTDLLHQFERPDLAVREWQKYPSKLQSMIAAIHNGAGPRLVSARQANAEHAEYVKRATAQHECDMEGYLPPFAF